MTISARKHREKEAMRRLILDAAKSIFLEKGFHSTSLRNIAEKIEYSPGTIYLYFKDKDEIFHALHEEGFAKMLQMMAPLQHVQDPMQRLIAMGRVYMNFAWENKDLYDLMFIMEAPINSEKDRDKWVMGNQTLEQLKQILTQCKQAGYFKDMDPEYLSFLIWSALHGMCALYCRNRCHAYEHAQEKDLLRTGMDYFIKIIERS
jgi:AcrR family transcriptional regulator